MKLFIGASFKNKNFHSFLTAEGFWWTYFLQLVRGSLVF